MRSAVSARRPDAFRRNLLRDCDRMEASLMPIARHSMWDAPMIPLDKDGMRDLLELKNIALLYELWTFFRLVHGISAVLGRPPVRSGQLTSDLFQAAVAAGGTFEWYPGVRLVYNQRFSRSRSGQRHSYSVPLIPDIALRVPDGPNAGLHLFDAKFRVQALTDMGLAADDEDADDEKAAERAGVVQACRHLEDARLPRRDSGRAVGVDPVPGCGVSVLWGAGGWGAGWRPGGQFA